MGLLRWMWSGVAAVGGLIFPIFAKAADLRTHGAKLRWVLHGVVLTLVLLGLGLLNYLLDVEKLLQTPLPILRKIWLPLLFFLVYLMSWLGWWLWRLLSAEEETAVFPDIDDAWEEAVVGLKQAGIDLTEVPLFLILGRPHGGEKALFANAQLELTLDQTPRRLDSPIHVFANEDAVYVTCPGASLLGRQALNYIEEDAAQEAGLAEKAPPPARLPQGDALSKSSVDLAAPPGRSAGDLESPSSSALAVEAKPTATIADDDSERPRRPAPVRTPLIKNSAEVERLTARLKHLCWLILRDRRPYCPLNGILLLIPYEGAEDDAEANQTGILIQRDLTAIRDVLQVHCPLFAVVCDLEQTSGFRVFIDRFPKGHRQRRLGQQFPYVPDLDTAAKPALIDSGVGWICRDLFPPLVYRLMRPEKPGRESAAAVLRGNIRLYRLMCDLRERRKRFSRILSLAVAADAQGPLLLGGCYFAGTGADPNGQDQAFVAAVFHRLLENQNFVSWTPTARGEEADYRRWTRLGYLALAAFLTVLVLVDVFSRAR